MKNYKEFIITAQPFNPDLISGCLWSLDIEGIQELENSLIVNSLETKEINKEDVINILNGLVNQNLLETFDIEEKVFEDKNWNEEWEKKLSLIEVTDRIVIKPSFKNYTSPKDKTIITIDPKMSFGTGEHQTTKLILMMMEKYLIPGSRVLDVGSGTGVLAIGSVLMGASWALGIDNDDWGLLNGNENVKLNNLINKVEIRKSEVIEVPEKNFNLILANINKNVLLSIKEEIPKRLTKGGIIILSGIFESDEEEIKKGYASNAIHFVEKLQMDEWIALIFRSDK